MCRGLEANSAALKIINHFNILVKALTPLEQSTPTNAHRHLLVAQFNDDACCEHSVPGAV